MNDNLNYDIYPTGNPFVDNGLMVIKTWAEKKQNDSITYEDFIKAYEELIPLYLNEAWIKQSFTIFPNSPLNLPNFKGVQKLEKYKEDLEKIFNSKESEADCIYCSRNKAVDYSIMRKTIPLVGSQPLTNFYPSFQLSNLLCPVCLFTVQLSPFAMIKCAGRQLLFHSNSKKFNYRWAKEAIENLERQKAMNSLTGCIDLGIVNPYNILFEAITNIIHKFDDWDESISVRIYYFVNFNQGVEVDIFDLPSNVFLFLTMMMQNQFIAEWRKFVDIHYYRGRNNYIDPEKDEKNKRKNSKNKVYENLLNNYSITSLFYRKRKILVSWKLLETYCLEVRNMPSERLNRLKEIADKIAVIIQKHKKSRLLDLENTRNLSEFRKTLRVLAKDAYRINSDGPLFVFEDYEEVLFPDNSYWDETKTIILFRLYEVLHTWLIDQEDIKKEELPEEAVNEEHKVGV